jgi:dGTPase
LWSSGSDNLDAGFTADWNAAASDADRKRVIVDQVASLTDQSAMAWHERLVR